MNIEERSESGCCGWDRLFGGGRDVMNGHGRVQSWAQDREAPLKGDLRAATFRLRPPKGDRMGRAVPVRVAGVGAFDADLQACRQNAGISQRRPWDALPRRHTHWACRKNAGHHPFLMSFGRPGGTNGGASAIALACPNGRRCRCPLHVILKGACAAAAATGADEHAGDGHLLRFLQVRRLSLLKVPERRLLSEWLDLAWMGSPLDSAPCLPELWLMD